MCSPLYPLSHIILYMQHALHSVARQLKLSCISQYFTFRLLTRERSNQQNWSSIVAIFKWFSVLKLWKIIWGKKHQLQHLHVFHRCQLVNDVSSNGSTTIIVSWKPTHTGQQVIILVTSSTKSWLLELWCLRNMTQKERSQNARPVLQSNHYPKWAMKLIRKMQNQRKTLNG